MITVECVTITFIDKISTTFRTTIKPMSSKNADHFIMLTRITACIFLSISMIVPGSTRFAYQEFTLTNLTTNAIGYINTAATIPSVSNTSGLIIINSITAAAIVKVNDS